MTVTSPRRRRLCATLAATPIGLALGLPQWLMPARAQAQSTPPLRVILPVSAGAGVDVMARSAQPALIQALGGRPVVIENLPGAGGIPGTQALVRAAPDGNTIAFLSNNHAVNPAVFKKLPFDSFADITPITVIVGSPFVLLVNPARIPARTAGELQALLKANPDQYNYGSSGNGTVIQLASEMFNHAVGVPVRHIPYKGTGPMVTDLIGGQIEMGVAAVSAVQNYLHGGQLRAIGIMGKQRVPSLPDIPTIAEQGFPEVDIAGWFVAAGPKNLAPDKVAQLREAIVTAFKDPQVQEGFARRDDYLILSSSDEAAAFLKSEMARYAALAKLANVQLD